MLLLGALAALYLLLGRPRNTPDATGGRKAAEGQTQAGKLPNFTPLPPEEIEDLERKVEAGFGPDGGVLTTEFPDGTKAYLVYPIETFVVGWPVTLAPLKTSPFGDFKPKGKFYGISIGPPDGTAGVTKDSYIVFDMRADKSVPTSIEQSASPCRFEVLYFQPDLCLAQKELPLGLGVDKGKVVFGYDYRYKDAELLYTYSVGDPNVVVAKLDDTGAYFFAEVDKTAAGQLVEQTLGNSNNYSNQLSAVAQAIALDNPTQSVKAFVDKLGENTSLPIREALQAATIASILGKTEIAEANLKKFDRELDIAFGNVRAFGDQWEVFPSLARAFNLSAKEKKFSAIRKLSALPRQDDQRIFDGIEAALGNENNSGEWDFALLAENAALREIESPAGTRQPPLFVDVAHAGKGASPEQREAAAGVQVDFAGSKCAMDKLYNYLRIFLEPRWGKSGARLGELARTEARDCIKKHIDEAVTFEQAGDALGEALTFSESDLAKAAIAKVNSLPAGVTCEGTKKTLANFGIQDCSADGGGGGREQ